jgi:hypothetical protein
MTRARNGAAPVAPVLASRSGPTQSSAARREAGRVPLQVWLTAEQKRRIEWIRATDGHDFATIVGCHIDQEWDERASEREP